MNDNSNFCLYVLTFQIFVFLLNFCWNFSGTQISPEILDDRIVNILFEALCSKIILKIGISYDILELT